MVVKTRLKTEIANRCTTSLNTCSASLTTRRSCRKWIKIYDRRSIKPAIYDLWGRFAIRQWVGNPEPSVPIWMQDGCSKLGQWTRGGCAAGRLERRHRPRGVAAQGALFNVSSARCGLTVSSNFCVDGGVWCVLDARFSTRSGGSGMWPASAATSMVCAALGSSSGCWPRWAGCSAASSPSASAVICRRRSRRPSPAPRRRRPPPHAQVSPIRHNYSVHPSSLDHRWIAGTRRLFGDAVLPEFAALTGVDSPMHLKWTCNIYEMPSMTDDRRPSTSPAFINDRHRSSGSKSFTTHNLRVGCNVTLTTPRATLASFYNLNHLDWPPHPSKQKIHKSFVQQNGSAPGKFYFPITPNDIIDRKNRFYI